MTEAEMRECAKLALIQSQHYLEQLCAPGAVEEAREPAATAAHNQGKGLYPADSHGEPPVAGL